MALPFPTDMRLFPAERGEVLKNIEAMASYARLGLRQDLGEGDLKRFASDFLKYTIKQLGRLVRFVDDDTDLLAWPARCLFEALLLTRYTLTSTERVTEFMLRCVKDYEHLQKEWSKSFEFDPASEAEVNYRDSLAAMTAEIEEEGLTLPGGKTNFHDLALSIGLVDLYHVGYPMLSKYVHPTPLQFMGDERFLHGEEARKGVLTFGQYSAAILLKDIAGRVEELAPWYHQAAKERREREGQSALTLPRPTPARPPGPS